MKLATVSLGCAPLLIQYWARSSFSVKLSPFLSGWYVPISSINLPSRGLRLSATTMRNAGVFLVPTRFMRIFTDINDSKELGKYHLRALLQALILERNGSWKTIFTTRKASESMDSGPAN